MKKVKIEIKDIPGYEDLYAVTNTGLVYSYRADRFLSSGLSNGYLNVVLYDEHGKRSKKVHRLVAQAYCKGDKSLQVNHLDGDKSNNSVGNLEFVTGSENVKHAYAGGLVRAPKGEEHHNSKLNSEQVKSIKRMSKGGSSNSFLAERFGVSRGYISILSRGLKWRHLC